jgi:hypothetical protein
VPASCRAAAPSSPQALAVASSARVAAAAAAAVAVLECCWWWWARLWLWRWEAAAFCIFILSQSVSQSANRSIDECVSYDAAFGRNSFLTQIGRRGDDDEEEE